MWKHIRRQEHERINPVVTFLWYPNQMVLPNRLKECTYARKTLIEVFTQAKPIDLGKRLAPFQKEVVFLHVLPGRINLKTVRKGFGHFMTQMLERYMSYQFSRNDFDQYEIILRPEWDSIMIYVEIREPEPPCPIPKEILTPPQAFKEVLEKGKSVNFGNIEEKEWVVIAARFGWYNKDPYPLQIVVLQIRPNILLMNTLVCPRVKIRNYAEDIHGITEEMLYSATDHYAA
jgi:hypothetical protein